MTAPVGGGARYFADLTVCGPKVLLGEVSRRCYRKANPWINPAKSGARGKLTSMIAGSEQWQWLQQWAAKPEPVE
jgi:hypothetical protein